MKKEGWAGGGLRFIKVVKGVGCSDEPIIKPSGKTLLVTIGPGMPSTTSK